MIALLIASVQTLLVLIPFVFLLQAVENSVGGKNALWLQMLKKEEYIYGMPDILMRYRIRSNSISSNKLAVIKYHWILYREIEHLNVFRSAFHICWWCFLKVFHIK